MKRTITLRLIFCNLIIACIIVLDISIHGNESNVMQLDSFYSALVRTGGNRKPTMEIRNRVDLLTGESYRISTAPKIDYQKGTELKIIRSTIFGKVNEILIRDHEWKKINVGLFSNFYIAVLFVFATLISMLNILFKNRFLNIALIGASMFIFIIAFTYIFYC